MLVPVDLCVHIWESCGSATTKSTLNHQRQGEGNRQQNAKCYYLKYSFQMYFRYVHCIILFTRMAEILSTVLVIGEDLACKLEIDKDKDFSNTEIQKMS